MYDLLMRFDAQVDEAGHAYLHYYLLLRRATPNALEAVLRQ